MEKQDLIDEWWEDMYMTYADWQIRKKDTQRRLVSVLDDHAISIRYEYDQNIPYPVNQTKT